jgi:glycine betaine catabolism B
MSLGISTFRGVWGYIERYLDQTAMYRIVTLALSFLAVVAFLSGLMRLIPYTALEQALSLCVSMCVALLVNGVCSKIWQAHVNMESAVITALIVHFLIIPTQLSSLEDSWIIALVTTLAIISKFVFAWHKQHIANPAATGLVLLALIYAVFPIPGYFESTWWIGRPELFVPLLIAGCAVVAKIRKWTPVLAFLGVAFVVFLIEEYRFAGLVSGQSVETFWFSGPSLFLAFFMLTEPFTMPPSKKLQLMYGATIGFISQTTFFLGLGIKMTPELALVAGNLLFYPRTLRRKLIMPLAAVHEVAKDTYEYAFVKPPQLRFCAGQYLEWMLPHSGADNRGIRRYFTIVSAPSDQYLKMTVRFGAMISSYKQILRQMKIGDTIIASQLAGDFVLPADPRIKVGMIAGGIGITPFLSQIDHMQAQADRKHDTVLFYCNNTLADVAYLDKLQAVPFTLPVKVVQVLVKEQVPPHETGYLTAEMIKKHTPDYLARVWFISGPPGMVNAYVKILRELGVPRLNIRRDFFPGLA